MYRLIVLCSAVLCVAPSSLAAIYDGGYGHGGYQGPIAIPVVLKSGYLADTHDVAAARHAHLVAHAEAKARSDHGFDDGGYGSYGGYSGGVGGGYDGGFGGDLGYDGGFGSGGGHVAYGGSSYHGPLAYPVVLKSGYLADTHEVAAAKSAHLQAYTEAAARAHHSGYGDEYYH